MREHCSLLGKRKPCRGLEHMLEVGNYETITDYILSEDNEDSNLSWLLTFKVASLFDSPMEQPDPAPLKTEVESTQQKVGKPPYTYTELIELALKENGQLTVADIYTWISNRFPYFQANDDRWKNSIRHNLSINPQFRKGMKAKRGAGHLWKLSDEGATPPVSWKPYSAEVTIDELERATASITETNQDFGLYRTAEEILSGVKKRVEVEYLTPEHSSNEDVKSELFSTYSPPHPTIFVVVPPTEDSILP
uniref:Fork-head domain-containing protein n=1 Tax=Clastoptera arizonana TaxID=38151 RepID=A0A1B6DPH2_9HEMI